MQQPLNDMLDQDFKSNISKKLDDIYYVFVGNPLTKTGGMIEKVDGIDARLRAVEEKQKASNWKVNIIWAIFVALGVELLHFVFDKK